MLKIQIKDDVANIFTPYNPDFIKRIKQIGGAKWNGETCWNIPATAVDAVREIMNEVFGYSDITENETISLKVTINEEITELRSDVVLFGKILAHAFNRNSGAKIGDDVAYISGGASSGGSAKNWISVVYENSVVILSNVNKMVYEKSKSKYNITVEILETKASKKSLLEEKERLLKRISEIDNLLNTTK